MQTPELLLPAGSVEAFNAALKAGADAIYVGFKKFSARSRAHNFTIEQLSGLIETASNKGVKVLVALNTVIKNNEISELLEYLNVLVQVKPYAVIVQDIGVIHLIQNYFPSLTIHASTQMNFHNSLGAQFAKNTGIQRIVLARELTKAEIKSIADKSEVELEVFIHGALCYSVSGMCLFSSYLGSGGANRGSCAQPCRRSYGQNKNTSYLFSLKDQIQFESIDFLKQNNISSLKVEGRMKSANYVWSVGQQYRKFLDSSFADKQLMPDQNFDFTRDKTHYFLGGNASNSFTNHPNIGLFLGKIISNKADSIIIQSSIELKPGYRLRLTDKSRNKQVSVRVNTLEPTKKNGYYKLTSVGPNTKGMFFAYLLSENELKFSAKMAGAKNFIIKSLSEEFKKRVIKSIGQKSHPVKQKLFIRVDSLAWLKNEQVQACDAIILSFSKKQWDTINLESFMPEILKRKCIVELPSFMFEKRIEYYKNLIERLKKCGLSAFMAGNLSHLEIIPESGIRMCNESVYTFNNAAIAFLKQKGVSNFIYPFENDLENLREYQHNDGIVPIYFYPTLFYARMPAKAKNTEFVDAEKNAYHIKKVDHMTKVYPHQAVSLTQYRTELDKLGYSKYLIDISGTPPSKNGLKQIVSAFEKSVLLPQTNTFNYKRKLQ